MAANGVNGAVHLTERQDLPRGIDHGIDLAQLGAPLADDEDVFSLVLDFKDAFMSVPLHHDEQRFNCANAGFDLHLGRDPRYPGEPDVGRFVVWRCVGPEQPNSWFL